MGKKKRQAEHGLPGDSSDSADENEGKTSGTQCLHLNKGILLSAVKKVLKAEGLPRDCSECKRSGGKDKLTNGHAAAAEEEEADDEENVYICLRCGHCGCQSKKGLKHAEAHSINKQADVHDIAVNPEDWTVWCFKCSAEIPSNATKQLLECVEFIRKRGTRIIGDREDSKDGTSDEVLEPTTYTGSFYLAPIPIAEPTPNDGLPRVRGLANLGNTCFMNAVLQCLAQTPFLLPILEEMREPGEAFQLPGGEVTIGEDKEDLDPLEGTLKEWGPLTAALADLLRELQSGRSDVMVPSKLRTIFTGKCPQFAGYSEHDSHELLRQLLDTVRTEDLQRYKTAILEKLSLDKKSERDQMSDRMRRVVKGYGRQASDLILRPSQVFRGDLVSTLVCQKCQHATDHVEHFLDLSLPVVSDKPVHVRRRTTEDDVSKYQLKKDRKRMVRRNHGKQYRQQTETGLLVQSVIEDNQSEASDKEDNSDADAEDENEDERQPTQSRDVTESGYSSEKPGNGDSGCGSPSNPPSIPCPSPTSLDSEMGGLKVDNTLEVDTQVVDPLLSDSLLDAGVPGSSVMEGGPIPLPPAGEFPIIEGAIALPPPPSPPSPVSPEPVYCFGGGGTMAPRFYTTTGECTLITCLNQFTAQELLSGNNKVGCEACTEKINGKNGKTIYTDASKQLLVMSPPAILILHLKRFQVQRFSSRKNSEEVKFPPILDLAPFCSAKARTTHTVGKDQTEVRYALYGIVQHSGSMHGGHYVAYVKVRPALSRDDPRWAFLPRDPSESADSPRLSERPSDPPEPPPGKWYYVSDSHVTDVRESRVLDSEAYLLFYERIW